MTLDELEALDTPTPLAGPRALTPADIEALDAPPPPASAPGEQPPTATGLTKAPSVSMVPDPDGAMAFSGEDAANPEASPGEASRYAGPARVGAAMLTGAAKSIYETKDFIFGKPEPAERSALRQQVEGLDKDLGEQSIGYGFVSGLSQFATGMLGAGKLIGAAKALPMAGAAITGAEATRKGAMLLSTGKAAAVGAVAFDPNGARLSDLVALQGPSWLQNPVTSYLAHTGHEDDTPALGRVKNALESIGVDAAMAGVFALSVKGYAKVQAYRAGSATAEEVQAATEELAQAVAHKDAKLAAHRGDTETLAALRETHPEATAQAEASLLPTPVTEAGTEVTIRPDGTAEVTLPELRTETPAAGALDTATGTAPTPAPLLEVSDEQVSRLMRHGEEDTAALMGPGGWEGAIERGYKFGDGGRIPWQKFALEAEHAPGTSPLDQVIRRVSDEFAGEIAAAKGGDGATGVRSDAMQDRMIAQRVAIYGDDPAELTGALQLAGRNADGMVADVAAADLITLRAATDAANLADRIKLGMLEEYGGDLSAAMTALRGHYQVAATARAQGAAIVANAARTLRRQRADFAYSLEDVAAMGRLSDAKMLNLIEAAGRDPRVADRLLRRGFWSRVQDDASYLYVNNLLWGLRTHFVNFATNAYMLAGRPLERMIGGALQGDRALVAENQRQYVYMATSLHEAWRDAVRTWTTGESILAPHTAELNAATAGRSTNWVAEGFKQWDSTPNILSNAYTGFMKAAGLPTRALGAVDELVKQVVYRSKVQAAAHADGIVQGLEGPALTEHVRRTLDKAFDDGGRAVDMKALEEASIATFQQDLLPGTFGSWVQTGTNTIGALRFVVPFVRTPTNVLRIGWKLTPGLNLLQGEYRQMLRGEMGAEKQAQAMGQFAMGSLFMGTAAVLTHAGHVTGGGPMNPELRKTLMATGWQPYSFVIPGEDGAPTYVNFGRYDPIAMPFGIIADVVDILERDQDGDGPGDKAVAALGGVFLSVVKQLGQKTYLSSLNDTLSAITSPEKGGLSKAAGGMAASFVPFASGLRFVNPDPNLRETRSIVDKIMATVPGLSETLPAKRDLFGDPMTVHKGLWVHGKDGLVDAEVRRMVDEAEVGPFGPPSSTFRGVDLRDVTTKDGRNAFEVYQELAGHPPRGPSLKEMVGRLIATGAYQRAPDKDPDVDNQKGTKQAMLTGTVHKYREAAGKRLMADPKVREVVFQQAVRGRAAYAAAKGPKTDQQAGAGAIAKVGQAFGVDLNGMVPEQ